MGDDSNMTEIQVDGEFSASQTRKMSRPDVLALLALKPLTLSEVGKFG
jgi:hypothetical protein